MGLSSVVAKLVDAFHLPISDIAKLTDFQIRHLYFAPRKKEGSLDAEKLEEKLRKRQERLRRWNERLNSKPTAIEKLEERRNKDWDEYFAAYKVLFDLHTANSLNKEVYQENMQKLQSKFSHLFEEKRITTTETVPQHKTTRAEIETYRLNGLINEDQYQELLRKLEPNG